MSDNTDNIDELKATIEALVAKNRELLGEVKMAKAKSKGAEINPEDFAALQHEAETLRATLDKTSKDNAKLVDGLNSTIKEKDGALQSYLIDNGLSDALIKANVRAEMMPAVKAMLKAKASIKSDNGQYSALMGDQPLLDAVTAWAASDEGKHFVSAPANSGGGAAGGNGNGGTHSPKGDMGGDKQQRINALKARFPDLTN